MTDALREALIRETIALLAERAPSEISIRDLARRLGVSSGAPFHHFADRPALFAAVAAEGWHEVNQLLDSASGEPVERLRAMTQIYLGFAVSHPERYRVMFLPELKDPARFAELHTIAFGTFWRFVGLAAQALARPPDDGDLALRVLAAWSTVHGFASLHASRTLEGKFSGVEPERVTDAVIAGAMRAALG